MLSYYFCLVCRMKVYECKFSFIPNLLRKYEWLKDTEFRPTRLFNGTGY